MSCRARPENASLTRRDILRLDIRNVLSKDNVESPENEKKHFSLAKKPTRGT